MAKPTYTLSLKTSMKQLIESRLGYPLESAVSSGVAPGEILSETRRVINMNRDQASEIALDYLSTLAKQGGRLSIYFGDPAYYAEVWPVKASEIDLRFLCIIDIPKNTRVSR